MISMNHIQPKYQRGLTLVELAVVMVVMSIGIIGMGTGVVAMVGSYKDDWLLREVRMYGYAAMNEIEEILQTADTTPQVDSWAKYDRVYVSTPEITGTIVIQGTENDGLLKGIEPLVENYRFPKEGVYREGNQRQVTLEAFKVKNIKEIRQELHSRPALNAIGRAIYDVTLVFGLRTLDPEFGEIVQYVTMHRQIYIRRLLIN